MSEDRQRSSLRRVGALWKPKPGAKSLGLGSGNLTINGLRQRFVVLRNTRKKDGSSEPDYLLMSSDEPDVDEYARRASTSSPPAAAAAAPEGVDAMLDEIPF